VNRTFRGSIIEKRRAARRSTTLSIAPPADSLTCAKTNTALTRAQRNLPSSSDSPVDSPREIQANLQSLSQAGEVG